VSRLGASHEYQADAQSHTRGKNEADCQHDRPGLIVVSKCRAVQNGARAGLEDVERIDHETNSNGRNEDPTNE